jgi:CBS domain-containing protein
MNELPEIARFLSGLPGFDTLSHAQVNVAAASIQIGYYRAGKEILHIGDENSQLHVVRSGAIELHNADGDLVTRAAEGDCFGFPSLMNASPVRHRSVAIEDALLYHIDGKVFSELRGRNAKFDTHFIRLLSDRLLTRPPVAKLHGAGGRAVSQLITRPPVTIEADASIRQAATAMVAERVSAMLIMDRGTFCGIVTDRDIRSRVVAAGKSGDTPIRDVMSVNPIFIEADALAYEAALMMMQRQIHHLPVCDQGTLAGMVSRSDFMRLETEHPLYLVNDIAKQTTVEGIVEACRRLPGLIASQINADANGEQLGKFVTTITDAITRQLCRIGEAELGSPPCDYAWVAMGSQGRHEQSARSDQDNALVLDDSAQESHDDYFKALAKVVNGGLNACGYVYCPGDVMASNPKWRQTLQTWKGYFSKWITVPEEKALMHANIFFDLRCVHGKSSLVDELKASIRQDARRNEIFLALMAKNAMNFQPPLGFFRQFVLQRSGEHKNTLDIKLHGIMPIVEIARIRALAAGEMRITTRNRLRAAASAGEITEDDAANLIDALDFIEKLRMEHQSRQLHASKRPDNHLSPTDLSPLVRQNLKSAFAQVSISQAALLNRFHLA